MMLSPPSPFYLINILTPSFISLLKVEAWRNEVTRPRSIVYEGMSLEYSVPKISPFLSTFYILVAGRIRHGYYGNSKVFRTAT